MVGGWKLLGLVAFGSGSFWLWWPLVVGSFWVWWPLVLVAFGFGGWWLEAFGFGSLWFW